MEVFPQGIVGGISEVAEDEVAEIVEKLTNNMNLLEGEDLT